MDTETCENISSTNSCSIFNITKIVKIIKNLKKKIECLKIFIYGKSHRLYPKNNNFFSLKIIFIYKFLTKSIKVFEIR